MSIMVSRDYESQHYFMNLFNSSGILMTRLPVTKDVASMDEFQQYQYVKNNHPDIYRKIK